MAYDATEGAASLHRLELDGSVTTVLRDLTISNGLGWSPDGAVLYLNDSGPAVTYAFDLVDGELGERRVLVQHDRGVGDGLAVDAEGCLWVPLWGGAAVDRIDPTGRRLLRIEVPAQQPSDVCLVDGRLVISTARKDLADPGPHDGQLLVADVGVSGPPVTPYGGVLPA
jgi:sugar lactone lactonase YvrE